MDFGDQQVDSLSPAGGPHSRRIVLASEPVIRIGALEINPRLRRVAHQDGREQLLEPRVMQVLAALARAGGDIVTRDELLSACWNGVVVGEDAIQRVIGRLRRLADNLGGFRLETVNKVGYRLCSLAQAPGAATEGPATAQGPSVCVLPFLNMSDDPQQTYFSDGITEDIITDLSKVSSLSVLARTTSFSVRDAAMGAADLARQLGVSHLLEGSVRKDHGRLRVTAQLIDGATGAHIWAERYDRPLEDLFALQDELTAAIVGALRVRLLPDEKGAIEHRGAHDPAAYELYLLARRYHLDDDEDSGEVRQLQAIERLCSQAVSLDPGFARAWSLLATAQATLRFVHNHPGDGGLYAIERALELDPRLAEAHAVRSRQLLNDGRHEEARTAVETALRLDPASPTAHAAAGRLHYVLREFEQAIPHLERTIVLGHKDAGLLMSAYHKLGDLENTRTAARKVLAQAEKVLAHDRINLSSIGDGVAALVCLGEHERAEALVERGLLIEPDNIRMRYNFACGMSAYLHDTEAALQLLTPIFEKLSAACVAQARSDPDLDPIRDDPRVEALFAAAKSRLAGESAELGQAYDRASR